MAENMVCLDECFMCTSEEYVLLLFGKMIYKCSLVKLSVEVISVLTILFIFSVAKRIVLSK